MLNWCEIDGRAIRSNIEQFRRLLGAGSVLGAVVKSNAYGHGMLEVAGLTRAAGVDWLCVNNVDEGVALREAGHDARILIMGYVPLDRLEDVVRYELRPVVYRRASIERLDELARAAGRKVPLHLKVETGTHRQGLPPAELPGLAALVRRSEGLTLEGVTTHFANIEDTTDHAYARRQMETFGSVLDGLSRGEGGRVPVAHAACSAAALLFRSTHLDMARIGISLYGLWPSRETYVSCRERGRVPPELKPALCWKTRIAQVKDVAEGSFVGYGCGFRTTRPSRIAVLPVGYYEGFDRGLSGVAHVLVRGKRAPVCGRVCMNMCMVDVTDVPGVAAEDEVVLLGAQGDEEVRAEQLAAWCGTIAYEIVSRIHPSLPRVVV